MITVDNVPTAQPKVDFKAGGRQLEILRECADAGCKECLGRGSLGRNVDKNHNVQACACVDFAKFRRMCESEGLQ